MRAKVVVLAYHRVSEDPTSLCVKLDAFNKQLSFLSRRRFRNLSLNEYLNRLSEGKKILVGKYVIITFDDGWSDNYITAFPILQKYGFVATIFLTVAYIGERKDYLSWDQVMEMKRAGFDFGSHTLTHPHLTKIPIAKARQEIMESKELLESHLGEEIKTFCYPYGEYDQDIIEVVKEAGYQGAVVTPPSGRCEDSIYTIRRVGLYSSDTMLSFRVKTSRLPRAIASSGTLWTTAKKLKRCLRI